MKHMGTLPCGYSNTGIIPTLVGKGIPDDNFLAAAYGCGVEVQGWFLDGNRLSVERIESPDCEIGITPWREDIIRKLSAWSYEEASTSMMHNLFDKASEPPIWIADGSES